MEDMDTEQAIDVPDTPDQLVMRTISSGECVEKEKDSVLSVVGHSGNPKNFDEIFLIRPEDRGRLANVNGYNRRLNFCSQKILRNPDESEHWNGSHLHPSGSSSVSINTDLFQRAAADKTFKDGTNHSSRPQHIDKGKALCTKFSSSFSREEDKTVVDLTEQNKNEQMLQSGIPCGASIDFLPKEVQEISLETGGCSSKTPYRNRKIMEETSDCAFKVPTSGVDRGKEINILCKPQLEAEKRVPAPPHKISLHRVSGRKRLVKNGCISPHNIAKAKQLAERLGNGSKGVEFNETTSTVLNGPPCLIDIGDSASEGRKIKDKGKGVITHPCMSKEHDAKAIRLPCRTQIHKEEADRTSDSSRGASDGLEGFGGWRSTRNRSKKSYLPSSDGTGGYPGRNDSCCASQNGNRVEKLDNGVVINNKTGCDSPEVKDVILFRHRTARPLAQTISSFLSESDQGTGRHHVANAHIKRQRKQWSAPSQPGECSTSVLHDSDVMFLGSAGESSNLKSTRGQNSHCLHVQDPIIEIEESPFERRQNASQGISCTNDDNSVARARQVEADEILARELQEQLYHEMPVLGGGEIDANIALTLQQEEVAEQVSSDASHRGFLRGSLSSRLYRSQFRSNQNIQVRRGNQARVPASNRMAQLRRRFRSQSPAIISRENSFPFPVQMDLDRRMDILEALEAAAGDLSSTVRASNIVGVQRDFNENDYEMLLALDENNHQHGGASVRRINSLPQSKVQTDNFEEPCAICLEPPTIGDTIRHLPCLHKFHKDCIDPWLRRRTSCPVCKSSIT